jgi:hypothetical protein
MTDRELMKMAAKAAGRGCKWWMEDTGWGNPVKEWNPLEDDGDALRLAVKLKLGFEIDFDRIDVYHENGLSITEYRYEKPTPTDQYAATRRAIVRAAAEIGKEMK